MLLWLPWRADATPHRTAVVAPDGERLSYAQLHRRADDQARRLASLGVRAGDMVAVLLPNGTAFAVTVHAAVRLGAVLLPLNLRLAPAELAWQLADAEARVVVCDARTVAAAAALDEQVAGLVRMDVDDDAAVVVGGGVDVALRDRCTPDEPLAVVYTSGTTGTPKGAVLTYSNFWWSAVGSALNLGLHDDDRWLAPLPLFHVGGLSVLTRSSIYGTTAVIHDGFDAARVSAAIDDEGVTLVSLVPTMLGRLLDERAGRPFPPSLRCVLLGGGPASRALLERGAALGVAVSQSYGLTESCSQATTLAPADALRKLGSAGRPLYPTELRIVRDDDSDAAAGEEGQIVLRGPTVTPGYRNRPEATARTLAGGWLHTGDVGRLDDEGFLYVLDRRDDLIVTGGENVYPAEVEGALLSHAAVAEAAVIGVPDAGWGQRVVAVVRLRDADADADAAAADGVIDADVLRAHCRERVAGYKVPREIRFTTLPLPRTASGKLKRSAIER